MEYGPLQFLLIAKRLPLNRMIQPFESGTLSMVQRFLECTVIVILYGRSRILQMAPALSPEAIGCSDFCAPRA